MPILRITIAMMCFTLFFTGCGDGGFSSTGSSGSGLEEDGGENQQQSGETNPDQPVIVDKNISFEASINDKSGLFGSGRLIHYNNETKSLEISVPFPLAAIMPNVSGPVPNYPKMSFRTDADEKIFTLVIPTEHYIDLVQNPSQLPGGRPLPGVNGGEPPTFGFPLDFLNLNAYGYAGFDSLSIFIPSSLKLRLNLSLPIKTKDGTNIGRLYWLAPLNNQPGGVFFSVRLPKDLSVLLANAQ